MHLTDLVFLRYLSVTEWFEGLEYVVSNNPNLQTLVSGNESQLGAPTIDFPSNIWVSPTVVENVEVYCSFPKLKKLKLFHRGGSCSNPRILDNLEFLEKLEKLTISVLVGCTVILPEQVYVSFPIEEVEFERD